MGGEEGGETFTWRSAHATERAGFIKLLPRWSGKPALATSFFRSLRMLVRATCDNGAESRGHDADAGAEELKLPRITEGGAICIRLRSAAKWSNSEVPLYDWETSVGKYDNICRI